jgi:multidrug efflux pump subunit AcrB
VNTLIEAALDRSRTVVLSLLLILISGLYAYITIPKEANPDITIPIIYVSMVHQGISPEDAERMLIRPMETELRGIEGVKEMTAQASEGFASVTLEFEAGFDVDSALNDVREKADLAQAELPEATEEPEVNEVNFSMFPVIVVTLSGDVPERTLVKLARDLQEKLEGINEVLEVDIGGDREEVVEILLDPSYLETYNLRQEDMFSLARRNNQLVAAGNLDSGSGRLPVKVPGLFEDVTDILNNPIKVVGDRVIQVSDVAMVRPTFKDPSGFARVNGLPAVTLEVKKRAGENVIHAVDKVRAIVEQEQAYWPEGLQVAFTQDQSDDIRLMLKDLQNNVLSAIILVMVVVVGALGLRTGLLVGVAIPGSFLAGILVLAVMGLTINIVVLFSLILAVGMLVDGAIVVTEFADRKMTEGHHRSKAYLMASQRMAMPILASTATTLAAFMPLLFWPGMVGEFMKYLPITLIATLSASLAMALVFVPTIGSLVGKPGAANPEVMKSLAASERGDVERVGGMTGRYVHILKLFIGHPVKTVCAAVVSLIGVFVLYGAVGKGVEFFPEVEPELMSIDIRMRGNLSAREMDDLVKEVEDRILSIEGVDTFYSRSGTQFSGQSILEDVHGIIQLEFSYWEDRATADAIMAEIRRWVEGVSELDYTVTGLYPGDPVEIRLDAFSGMPVSLLEEKIALVEERIRALIPGAILSREDLVADAEGNLPPGRLVVFLEADTVPDLDHWKGDLRAVTGGALLDLTRRDNPNRVEVLVRPETGQGWEGQHRLMARAAKVIQKKEAGIITIDVFSGTQVLEPEAFPRSLARLTIDTPGPGAPDQEWSRVSGDFDRMMNGVPGIILNERRPDAGPPVGKPIQIEVSSRFSDRIEPVLLGIREKMESMPGLIDIDDTRPVPAIEWQVEVNRVEASKYGADITQVGNAIQFVTNGLEVGTYRPEDTDEEVEIRVRYPRTRRSLDAIDDLRIQTPFGLVPIRQFVTREPAQKVGNVQRTDGQRVLKLSANVKEGYLADDLSKELQEWIQAPGRVDPRVQVRFRGEDEEQREAEAFLSKAFLVALFVMGMVLVTQFNNFYHALLILSAVVFSTIGVFLGLIITQQPFGIVMNGIGVISLAGIVVNNNIVLIDTYSILRSKGMAPREAVLRTGAQRLRPVLLTTVTTVLGLLPMVFSLNIDFFTRHISYGAPSTQWWTQLSTSVAFGLVFATGLTLILTPSLLYLGEKLFHRKEVEAELETRPAAASAAASGG